MRPTPRLALLALMLATSACAKPPVSAPGAAASATATASTSTPAATSAAAQEWFADVGAIANADAGAGRRTAIQQRLQALGIQWHDESFEIDGQHGVNLLAEVVGNADAPVLLLGAHSDQVGKGEGATDNASGSATVLALAKRLKERPLAHHRVAIAFWDLEEKGLLGSKAHVARGEKEAASKPALYVNFDVFGWGDTIWMMTPEADGALARASTDAATAKGLKLSAGEHYPPTDHLAFLKSGWPAVSYSLIGGEEISLILDAYAGKKLETVPRVLQVIHTDADTLAQIDANAAVRGIDAVEAALRQWDANASVEASGGH